MEETVECGGGDSAITVEDGSPLFEGFVGGKYDRTAFVALADDLEEKIGSALIDGKVGDLIQVAATSAWSHHHNGLQDGMG